MSFFGRWSQPRAEADSSRQPVLYDSIVVELPDNATPGDTISVASPYDDQVFAVIVPDNVQSGNKIEIQVERPTPSGATTVVNESTASAASTKGEEGAVVSDGSDISENKKALGVTIAAVVVGTLIVGPVSGVILAGGALYASQRRDYVGDAARKGGELAVKAYNRASEIDKAYGITTHLKAAAATTYTKAKEIDAEFKISEKAREAGATAAGEARKIDNKYKISSSVSSSVSKAVTCGVAEGTKAVFGGAAASK